MFELSYFERKMRTRCGSTIIYNGNRRVSLSRTELPIRSKRGRRIPEQQLNKSASLCFAKFNGKRLVSLSRTEVPISSASAYAAEHDASRGLKARKSRGTEVSAIDPVRGREGVNGCSTLDSTALDMGES